MNDSDLGQFDVDNSPPLLLLMLLSVAGRRFAAMLMYTREQKRCVLVALTLIVQVGRGQAAEQTRLFVGAVLEHAQLFARDAVLFANVFARVDRMALLRGA